MSDATPHRATLDQWHNIDQYRKLDRAPDHISITLELADRLAAAEQRISELQTSATCPHIVTSDEGTSHCGLAEQQAAAAAPPKPAPAGSLVRRVEHAIANADEECMTYNWAPEARAAIREVAEWLRSQDLSTGDYWAGRLEQEAQQ